MPGECDAEPRYRNRSGQTNKQTNKYHEINKQAKSINFWKKMNLYKKHKDKFSYTVHRFVNKIANEKKVTGLWQCNTTSRNAINQEESNITAWINNMDASCTIT